MTKLVPEMMIAVEQELKDQGYQTIDNEKGGIKITEVTDAESMTIHYNSKKE